METDNTEYIQEEPGYQHTDNDIESANQETESANHMYEASNDVKEYQTGSGSDSGASLSSEWGRLLFVTVCTILLQLR